MGKMIVALSFLLSMPIGNAFGADKFFVAKKNIMLKPYAKFCFNDNVTYDITDGFHHNEGENANVSLKRMQIYECQDGIYCHLSPNVWSNGTYVGSTTVSQGDRLRVLGTEYHCPFQSTYYGKGILGGVMEEDDPSDVVYGSYQWFFNLEDTVSHEKYALRCYLIRNLDILTAGTIFKTSEEFDKVIEAVGFRGNDYVENKNSFRPSVQAVIKRGKEVNEHATEVRRKAMQIYLDYSDEFSAAAAKDIEAVNRQRRQMEYNDYGYIGGSMARELDSRNSNRRLHDAAVNHAASVFSLVPAMFAGVDEADNIRKYFLEAVSEEHFYPQYLPLTIKMFDGILEFESTEKNVNEYNSISDNSITALDLEKENKSIFDALGELFFGKKKK